MSTLLRNLRAGLTLLAALTLLLGVIYPGFIAAVGRALFAHQASGSLIFAGDTLVGSELIGQKFAADGYFWGRPSATMPHPYDGSASSGSNLGPLNPALFARIDADLLRLREHDPEASGPVPVDLLTSSASGLDPDISLAAAEYQVARVARVRRRPPERLRALIAAHARQPALGFIGEPRVNVLSLNLALDRE